MGFLWVLHSPQVHNPWVTLVAGFPLSFFQLYHGARDSRALYEKCDFAQKWAETENIEN